MVPRSISVTRAPCSTAFSAAAIAAPPLPMTAICNAPLLPVLSFLPSRSRILSSNPPGVETEGIGQRGPITESSYSGRQRVG